MIMMEMSGMASRLTQQARKEAAAKVERWRQVIEIVRQSEQQAGMSINLPPHLTASANRAVPAIPSADYVTAVGIVNKAIDATHQVFEAGIQSLQSEIQICIEGLQKAEDGLKWSNHEQARRKKELSNSQQNETTVYNKSRYQALPTEPSFIDGAKIGCIGGPIVFGGLCLLNLSTHFAEIFGKSVFVVLFLFGMTMCFGGWLIIPIISRLLYMAAYKSATEKFHSHEQSLADRYKMQSDDLMRQTQPDMISLEQTIASLIAKRQKAEVALKFLTARRNELG